jgi:hypothetical protein
MKSSRARWNTKPVTPNGLLCKASVALQGLLTLLADTSRVRECHPLVLQHKRSHPALGQAQLQASGATELISVGG